jgi:hypothetical protein
MSFSLVIRYYIYFMSKWCPQRRFKPPSIYVLLLETQTKFHMNKNNYAYVKLQFCVFNLTFRFLKRMRKDKSSLNEW